MSTPASYSARDPGVAPRGARSASWRNRGASVRPRGPSAASSVVSARARRVSMPRAARIATIVFTSAGSSWKKCPTAKRSSCTAVSSRPVRSSSCAHSARGMSVKTPAPSPSPSTTPDRCASEAMPWSTSSRTARVGRASLRAIATSAQASCSLATFPPGINKEASRSREAFVASRCERSRLGLVLRRCCGRGSAAHGSRLWEQKVAEQRSNGRASVPRLLRPGGEAHWPSSRPQLREQRGLCADEHLDRVAHADRRGNGAHGAERTAPTQQQLPEFLTIGNTEQLADVGAGLAGAVHSQRHASDAELRVYRQVGHVGQSLDRYLLAEIAWRKPESLERGAVDHEHGARRPMGVHIAFETAADASDHLGHGRGQSVLLGSHVERDDAAAHSFFRTIQKSSRFSAISKPAFTYIDS